MCPSLLAFLSNIVFALWIWSASPAALIESGVSSPLKTVAIVPLSKNSEPRVAPLLDSAICSRQKESSKYVECVLQVKGLWAAM